MPDSDDKPDPPARPAAPSWARRWGPVVVWLLTVAAGVIAGALGVPAPPPVFVDRVVEVPSSAAPPPAVAPAFGWVRDDAAVARNLDPAVTTQFDATPAGKAVLGDEDVFLWRSVRKVNPGQRPDWYPNVNQRDVGCCVGCGWKHCADVCQAVQITQGQAAEWQPVSVEAIYGGSRVDVGGGRIRGDGSVGAWAREYVQTRAGVAAMKKYPAADLTEFSPARAREWGARGVPADVAAEAKTHPVKGCALVKSWTDVKRAVGQGYPVAVCSSQGFTMFRDRDGFARPQGTWPHCMAVVGVRAAPREGGFILNSWGDAAHTGPAWPEDMPVAGFWADAAVIDRMVRQGDSFALSELVGFPARKLDWFVSRPGRLEPAAFALSP